MAERIGLGKFFGFPIFELDTFNNLERHHLSACDEIIVCSEWAKSVIEKTIGKKTHVAPLGVDRTIFPEAPVREDSKTIFFNCGKWEVRKGHDILIKAFEKVLGHGEDAELWMMCNNPFNSPEEDARWQKLYHSPQESSSFLELRHSKKCIILCRKLIVAYFLSRGEGWNLEL